MHLQDAMIKSFFSFSSIRVFVLIKSVQDMKNLDADVASVQHGNVRFANLGNDACSMQIICIYFCNMFDQFTFIKTKLLLTTVLVGIAIIISNCSKVVDVDIPTDDPMLVVEGVIKQGEKPIVLLGLTQGYFNPVDTCTYGDFYNVSGATVNVIVDGVSTELVEVSAPLLEPNQIEYLSDRLKVHPLYFWLCPFPVYTLIGQTDLVGTINTEYQLNVEYENYSTSATTTLYPPIPFDDSYFSFPVDSQSDSLGVINIVYTDPDTLGNCYRWSSKRINKYPEWHELAGQVKDPYYIYPIGSSWDDMLLNGGVFDLMTIRYPSANDHLDSLEAGLWKVGDTVLTKLETIDFNAYETLLSYETAMSAQGNPFAPPSNVISHLDSALGWWIAISEDVDTIICQP